MGYPANSNTELTSSEKDTLKVYRAFLAKHKTPPSGRQLAALCGIGETTVRYQLRRLMMKGYLREKPVTEMRLTLSAKGRKVPL